MANIFLTNSCNLKCPYCFANEFVNKGSEEITFDNFKKALNFIKTDPEKRVGLIGGEPLLHPNFPDFLNLLIDDKDIKSIVIYTNGLELDKYIDLIKDDRISILINCNSPKDIGDKLFKKLENNIYLLNEHKPNSFALGINLYSNDLDYSYVINLVKNLNQHKLRFSTALSNSDKINATNPIKDFSEIQPYLFKFLKDCYDNNIIPINDCNAITHCTLNTDEKKLLIMIQKLSKKYKVLSTLNTVSVCLPIIDILPDLSAVRCFGLSNYLKVPINNFKNIKNLKKYFFNKIDVYARLIYLDTKCLECKARLIDKCMICHAFKIAKIDKLIELTQKEL